MDKQAESPAVPFADAATTQASMAAVPTPVVGNKPAPGQTGPKGMAPRTSYSRVNSGASPTADLGASAQKSVAPDSQSFLPPKISHIEVPMEVTHRLTIQEMIKAAAAGAQDHAATTLEAERQLLAPPAPATKVASAAGGESIPTAYVEKFASAVEFILKESAEPGPGTGPNHLAVTESMGGKNPFQPGNQGAATPANQPPKDPGLHRPSETPHGPANALDDNAGMKHPAQPAKLAGVTVADMRKAASTSTETSAPKVAAKDEKEMCKGCGKEKTACSCDKTAGVNPKLVEYFMAQTKIAEDAINPAHITAGAAVPPETSASGEAGGAPAGGQPKGPTGLIASNEAAINATKGSAKAPVRSDMKSYLTEPALSSAHDKTLSMAFSHTGQAGTKMASIRTAAARVMLEKMAADAEAEADDKSKTKKKESAGGGFTAPPVGGVASSASGM